MQSVNINYDLQSGAHNEACRAIKAEDYAVQTVKQLSLYLPLHDAMLCTSSCLQGFQQLPNEEDVGQQLQVDEQGGAGQPQQAVPRQCKAAQVVHPLFELLLLAMIAAVDSWESSEVPGQPQRLLFS
jgi:hypothetical protein